MPVLFVIFIVGIIITLVLAVLGAHGWGALCKFSAEASGREWYYFETKAVTERVFLPLVIFGAIATVAALAIALHLGYMETALQPALTSTSHPAIIF